MTDTQIEKKELLENIIKGIEEVKGYDITILNFTKLENTITDYFVICTGGTNTQVSAISNSVERFVRKNTKDKPWHIEGVDNQQWVLMDYVSIVVHIFQPEYREYYDLENLWGDVEITRIPNPDK
ncbi:MULTISPECIES: ribosome silencing factor [Apibacter]|uniref:ribosome silencing factor n=1 Tax=Apibacter TaxID=1778601 RepID=UPI000CF91940|nr:MULTISPECIES: ribosome silencing factor [Apibacter]MCX8677917.1 ribosome silencing factor [Apibacter sp. B3919]MXO25130.1 ribosome silencing factor [Apibacter sp. B3924]MXO27333.1 ribosome silencing factor [Apibacter sp. B3813]MXO29146.1 ribosome silencing factor [Apibacter sp. B3913]MXO31351.1 ribosome silencing factor [Apibacter sp. B3912]